MHVFRFAVVVGMAASVLSCAMSATNEIEDKSSEYEILTLSSRPDMVTGGDALVALAVPDDVDTADIRVMLGDRDVTSMFQRRTSTHLTGLVDGLISERTDLTLADSTGTVRASVSIVNHPAEGPVFSGSHEQPFVCQTDEFELVSGETLGPPLDESCLIDRRVDYAYRSTESEDLQPLDPLAPRPDDLATTTTLTGNDVPYIVRIETGTINRAV